MGNALEFIMKLVDQLSPAMRSAAGATDSSTERITRDMNQITARSKVMGASINDLRDRLEQVNKVRMSTRIADQFASATREAKKLEQQIAHLDNNGASKSSSGSMLGGIVGGNLISGLISKGVGLVGSGISSVITSSAKQEQNLVGLKTFLGEAGAKEAYGNIKKDAAVTPFDTESLLMVNRALISAGVNAKDARTDTMNLANAISAVGGSNDELSRMAVNMQQIKTVGKASAMDIKQFAFSGINIYKLLADETGKNINQVKEMDVSYELLSRSLQHAAQKGGAYFGALEAQGKTVSGKWSTFMDNIQNAAADLGTSLQPLMHWFLDIGVSITNSFSNIQPYLQPVIDMLNGLPTLFNDILSPTSQWSSYINTIKEFSAVLWATIKSIAGNIWDITSRMIAWIGKSELLKDIFWAVGKVAEIILGLVGKLGDAMVWIWDKIISPMFAAFEQVYKNIKSLFGGSTKADVQVTHSVKTAAGLPSASAGVSPLDLIGTAPKSNTSDLTTNKTKADAINGGGQRSIVINIGKGIEKIELHTVNMKEGVDEISKMFHEMMMRTMYSVGGMEKAGA